MSKPKEPDLQVKAEAVDQTRRRLLGMAKYVPPVVLGVISLQQAGCQPGPSCNPSGCNPNGGPCGPGGMCMPVGGIKAQDNLETAPLTETPAAEVEPVPGS